MYYQEEVINGILCFRTSPTDTWHEVSKKALTERVLRLVKELSLVKEKHDIELNIIINKIDEIKKQI